MKLVMVLCILLAGCANAPESHSEYGQCTLMVQQDAGMGVRKDSCAAWVFGPTKFQKWNFEQRELTRKALGM